jgi:catechol 2,3-dioxygenase-like lactoylglutathione lyase family enzyme
MDAASRPAGAKARALGLHHVALQVGDIDQALAFYRGLFDLTVLDRGERTAYLDLSGQFLVLQQGDGAGTAPGRHVGLIVDDSRAVRRTLRDRGIDPAPGPFLHVLDPWGNRLENVCYD